MIFILQTIIQTMDEEQKEKIKEEFIKRRNMKAARPGKDIESLKEGFDRMLNNMLVVIDQAISS